MNAVTQLLLLPFRVAGELVRLIRWVLYVVLLFCGNRISMAVGTAAMWFLYAWLYPQANQTDTIWIGLAMVAGWLLFCKAAGTIARLIVRPGMRLEPITMPAPPRQKRKAVPVPAPPRSPAAKPLSAKPPGPVPISPVPTGPVPPRPTRVALLVPPASPAASPDEVSMVAALPPALRELMRQGR